jgi:ribonuclease Z
MKISPTFDVFRLSSVFLLIIFFKGFSFSRALVQIISQRSTCKSMASVNVWRNINVHSSRASLLLSRRNMATIDWSKEAVDSESRSSPLRNPAMQRVAQLCVDPIPPVLNPIFSSQLKKNNGGTKTSNISSTSPGKGYKAYNFPVGALRDFRVDPNPAGDLDITFLGTASCIPGMTRGVSSMGLRYKGETFLFDCGEGTQIQIQKSSTIRPARINKIFISHLHGDHCFGLPGLLCLIGRSWLGENGKLNEDVDDAGQIDVAPIEIYGPEGLRDMIRVTAQLTYSRITVPYRVHELKNIPFLHQKYTGGKHFDFQQPRTQMAPQRVFGEVDGGRDIFPESDGTYKLCGSGEGEGEGEGLSVAAAPMQHTVPCVGFVLTEPRRAAPLQPDNVAHIIRDNAAALTEKYGRGYGKVFGRLKMLQEGEYYEFPDGQRVFAADVMGRPRKGRKIVVMGDTCSGEHIAGLAHGADVLIHEATNAYMHNFDAGRTMRGVERTTIAHGHSTPQMAGRFAARIKAKQLILTHFSSRYSGDCSPESMRTMWNLEHMARLESGLGLQREDEVVSKEQERKNMNAVIAAWDHMSLNIAPNEEECTD